MIAQRSHRDEIDAYMKGVLKGTIVAGRLVKLAVRRQIEDMKNAKKRGFYFDEEAANDAIGFAGFCTPSKGEWAGRPLVLAPWQKFIVWCAFGWRQLSDGMRRFRRVYICIGRKNGKSTMCAYLALLLLAFDNPLEPGAEVYVAATKEQQACIVHSEATRMVKASESLRRLITSLKNNLSIPSSDSFFRPLGSDSDKTDGLNPHGVIMDELHAWREQHRGLHEKLTTGGASRRQPLEITITTAGDEKSTIWKEEHDFAARCVESVITGEVISDTTFAFVACIDKDDDPLDEDNWPKANPNIDVSVKRAYLREKAEQARKDPTKLNAWLRYHVNVQVSSSEKAISAELWALGASPVSNTLAMKPCHGGFDLGRSQDFAAIALSFPFDMESDDEDVDDKGNPLKRFELIQQSWTCEGGSLPLHQEPFRSWIDSGYLKVSEGDDIDFDDVESTIVAWSKMYDVRTWAYDPTFAGHMAQHLLNTHGLQIFPFTQAARFYNEPIRSFLKALREKRIAHGNDPCLDWQAKNLCIRKNAKDEWMPDKGESSGKIDAMVALLMAHSECLFSDASGASIYSQPGNLAL